MLRKLGAYYPLQFEIIPAGVLVFIVFYALSNYATLPDQIPTHFSFNGEIDRWGGKSEVLVYPAIAAAVYLLLSGINLAFAVVKDPKSLINLPDKQKAALSASSAERLREVMLRCLLILKTIMLGLVGFLLYSTVEAALGKSNSLPGNWIFLFVAALLAVVFYMLIQVLALIRSGQSRPSRPG